MRLVWKVEATICSITFFVVVILWFIRSKLGVASQIMFDAFIDKLAGYVFVGVVILAVALVIILVLIGLFIFLFVEDD